MPAVFFALAVAAVVLGVGVWLWASTRRRTPRWGRGSHAPSRWIVAVATTAAVGVFCTLGFVSLASPRTNTPETTSACDALEIKSIGMQNTSAVTPGQSVDIGPQVVTNTSSRPVEVQLYASAPRSTDAIRVQVAVDHGMWRDVANTSDVQLVNQLQLAPGDAATVEFTVAVAAGGTGSTPTDGYTIRTGVKAAASSPPNSSTHDGSTSADDVVFKF